MQIFECGTRIISGRGALGALRQMQARRLLVVTDPYFMKNGVATRLAAMAPVSRIFDRVTPDPTVTLTAEGTAVVQTFMPDVVVALGGGSAMDCAKAMLYFSGCKAKLVAVPTTSGSGSEVTDFAILSHDGVKHPLIDPALRPSVAILDEELLENLPKSLIADAGFDVLSHALEALVATKAGAITDALARDAFCGAYTALPASFAGEKWVRLRMHTAATMAGMAFTQAGLGLCHGVCHSLGGRYHVPHGRLNAIVLPVVLECNAVAAGKKYAALACAAGLSGGSQTMGVRSLKNALVRLRRQLSLPETLAEAGVKPQVLQGDMEALVTATLQDPCCETNPVPVTAAMVRQLLIEVMGRG